MEPLGHYPHHEADDFSCNICNREVCGCDEIYDSWKDSQLD